MSNTIIPENYQSALNLHDTQVAIKLVKDCFQSLLTERLHLRGYPPRCLSHRNPA